MNEIVELKVPAKIEYLRLVRAIVGSVAASDPEMNSDRVADLRIIVSEAVTNAIRAQEKIGVADRVTIRCNLKENFVQVEVADNGPGFDPEQVVDLPDVESFERLHHESGLGLFLIRELADETTISSGPGGTAVRLTVRYGDQESLSNR